MKRPANGLRGRMGAINKSRIRIALVGIIAAVFIAGAGIGVYIGIKGRTAFRSGSDGTGTTVSTQGEILASESNADIEGRSEAREDIAYMKDGDIFIARLDGSGENKVTARGDITDFKPSPSGKMIAFTDSNGVLFLMDCDGGSIRQVTLPEWFVASNPVFHPDEEYLYFTCIARRDMTEPSLRKVMLRRHHVQDKLTETVYAREIEDFQSICELVFHPSGEQLYFNIAGSQFPGIGSFKLNLKPLVSEERFLPDMNIPGHGYTCQSLLAISSSGDHIAFHKDSASVDEAFSRTSWTLKLDSGEEVAIEGNEAFQQLGAITNIQFSQVDPNLYYLSKKTGHDECSESDPYSEEEEIFYTGRIGSQAQEPTGLTVTIRTNNIDGNSIWYPILTQVDTE